MSLFYCLRSQESWIGRSHQVHRPTDAHNLNSFKKSFAYANLFTILLESMIFFKFNLSRTCFQRWFTRVPTASNKSRGAGWNSIVQPLRASLTDSEIIFPPLEQPAESTQSVKFNEISDPRPPKVPSHPEIGSGTRPGPSISAVYRTIICTGPWGHRRNERPGIKRRQASG